MKVEILKDFILEVEEHGSRVKQKLFKGQVVAFSRGTGKWVIERGYGKEILPPPVKIHSELMNEEIWLVNSTEQMNELIMMGVQEPIYIPEEITQMKGFDKERIKTVQDIKKTFPGSVILEKSEKK